MFWRRKKLEYQILIPPLEKPFNLLRKAEAQEYFNWYMSKLDERIAYLKSVSAIDLDYSPSSLVPLWSWFLKNAEIDPLHRRNSNHMMSNSVRSNLLFATFLSQTIPPNLA